MSGKCGFHVTLLRGVTEPHVSSLTGGHCCRDFKDSVQMFSSGFIEMSLGPVEVRWRVLMIIYSMSAATGSMQQQTNWYQDNHHVSLSASSLHVCITRPLFDLRRWLTGLNVAATQKGPSLSYFICCVQPFQFMSGFLVDPPIRLSSFCSFIVGIISDVGV